MLMQVSYRIVGNFHGIQFSRMVNLCNFAGLIFADACTHAHYVLYNRPYFVGLIFAVRQSSTKIGPLKISRYKVFKLTVSFEPNLSFGESAWV